MLLLFLILLFYCIALLSVIVLVVCLCFIFCCYCLGFRVVLLKKHNKHKERWARKWQQLLVKSRGPIIVAKCKVAGLIFECLGFGRVGVRLTGARSCPPGFGGIFCGGLILSQKQLFRLTRKTTRPRTMQASIAIWKAHFFCWSVVYSFACFSVLEGVVYFVIFPFLLFILVFPLLVASSSSTDTRKETWQFA